MKKGIVDTNCGIQEVLYKFISEDEIKCINSKGYIFYTHYKSLVINQILITTCI